MNINQTYDWMSLRVEDYWNEVQNSNSISNSLRWENIQILYLTVGDEKNLAKMKELKKGTNKRKTPRDVKCFNY